jgi:excisionase family DNA binding protein
MSSRSSPGNPSGPAPAVGETPWGTEGFLSVTEASSVARVSDETIRAWYDCGEITGIRDERGHRLIDRDSLRRRLESVGVVEAARIVDRSPYIVRQWFDHGQIDGYLTATGRRRIFRSSIDEYAREIERNVAAKGTS